jgi:hypothetical protein
MSRFGAPESYRYGKKHNKKTFDAFSTSDMISSESVYQKLANKEEEKRESDLIDARTENFILGIINRDQRLGIEEDF